MNNENRPSLLRTTLKLGLALALGAAALGFYSTDWGRAFGSRAEGERLSRMQSSKHYENGVFVNTQPTTLMTGSNWTLMRRWLFERAERTPRDALAFPAVDPARFDNSPVSRLRLTWLGHSTVLIEIDGQRVLTDPVFSERASPSRWLGPKRFFPPPLPLSGLPTIDVVVISHDHYDHLDRKSILELDRVTQKFFVPLGVGAHLSGWGIDESKIVELDWWESGSYAGLEFTATPARHFSGRGLTDRNSTEWCSWTIVGGQHRVFYSGDTGYSPVFKEIGKRFGPFDASLVEAGAYDALWKDIHLGPKNTLEVHRDLRARVLLPVHWGTFQLALHAWMEPIVRLRALANEHDDVRLAQPYPGESFEVDGVLPHSRWWSRAKRP